MDYKNKYLIVLLGNTGSLSKSLKRELIKSEFRFLEVNISRRDSIENDWQIYSKLEDYLKDKKNFIIINTIVSLNPKSKSDNYINKLMPFDLLSFCQRKNAFLIHLSTNNVLNVQLRDKYTLHKKKAEEIILNSSYKNYMIIRLPLIIPIDDIAHGKIPSQFKLLIKLLLLPLVSIIPPSRNIYKPMKNYEISEFIISNVIYFKKQKHPPIINLNGKKEMNLKDISRMILKIKNKKSFIIKIPFLWEKLDYLLKIFPRLKSLFKSNTFLQQLLPIKR